MNRRRFNESQAQAKADLRQARQRIAALESEVIQAAAVEAERSRVTESLRQADSRIQELGSQLEAAKLAVQASAQVFSSLQQSSLLNVLK